MESIPFNFYPGWSYGNVTVSYTYCLYGLSLSGLVGVISHALSFGLGDFNIVGAASGSMRNFVTSPNKSMGPWL